MRKERPYARMLRNRFPWVILVAMLFPISYWLYSAAPSRAQEESMLSFVTLEVLIDSGDQPLAAYQLRFEDKSGLATLSGIEGGEHPVFREPPHYDPAALTGGRVILAAFTTAKAVPQGETRVATLHLMVKGDAKPEYVVELQVAADPEGRKFPAEVRLRTRDAKK